MNLKNIIMGLIFYIVVTSIEGKFNLKTYSLLIPATILIVTILMVIENKKRSE